MNRYWKVRIHNAIGHYAECNIQTTPNLTDIAVIAEFYEKLTGVKMLVMGMSESPASGADSALGSAFRLLWETKRS